MPTYFSATILHHITTSPSYYHQYSPNTTRSISPSPLIIRRPLFLTFSILPSLPLHPKSLLCNHPSSTLSHSLYLSLAYHIPLTLNPSSTLSPSQVFVLLFEDQQSFTVNVCIPSMAHRQRRQQVVMPRPFLCRASPLIQPHPLYLSDPPFVSLFTYCFLYLEYQFDLISLSTPIYQ